MVRAGVAVRAPVRFGTPVSIVASPRLMRGLAWSRWPVAVGTKVSVARFGSF